MFMTRFVQFTKKPSQTFSPLWYSLQEPHCCWINLLEYGNLSRCVLVLLISPKKKKKKITFGSNRGNYNFLSCRVYTDFKSKSHATK